MDIQGQCIFGTSSAIGINRFFKKVRGSPGCSLTAVVNEYSNMIYLLPGMGANSKMYQESWSEIEPATSVDWPSYQGEKSLSELAARLVDLYDIQDKDILIGSSMGGMIALEIFEIVDLSRVILIGSAINPSEINSFLLSLSPLADITPIKLIQKLVGKYNDIVPQMFASSESVFVKEMCKAISIWNGFKGDNTRVVRIHGEKDKVIRCPQDCFVIKNGGHLISISHSRKCVDIVNNLIH